MPVALIKSRSDKSLHEAAIKVDPIAAGHKHNVIHTRTVFPVRNRLALWHKARRKHQIRSRRTLVRYAGVGVEMLERRIAGVNRFERCPTAEVFGGRASNPAHTVFEVAFACHTPRVGDIFLPLRVPKSDVVRIKGSIGQDWIVLHQAPAETVGRYQREYIAGTHDGFVPLFVRRVGIEIKKRRHIVARSRPNEVIVP